MLEIDTKQLLIIQLIHSMYGIARLFFDEQNSPCTEQTLNY